MILIFSSILLNRKIIQQRKDFDYKIDKKSKSIQDYLRYIAYENDILVVIVSRRRSKHTQSQRNNLEQFIAMKIIGLYKQALAKYPDQRRLYDNFITFCNKSKNKSEIPPYLEKLLNHHGDKPDVWVSIVMWEYEQGNNLDRVRRLVSRGLRKHPLSSELYVTLFNIELQEVNKLNSEKQAVCLRRAEIIYCNSKKDIHKVEFMIELLRIAEGFSFTKQLQGLIIKDMTDIFPTHVLTWNALAQRELKGYHLTEIRGNDGNDGNDCDYSSALVTPKDEIIECSEETERLSIEPSQESQDPEDDIISEPILMGPPPPPPPPQEKLTYKKRIQYCVRIYNRAATLVCPYFSSFN